MNQKPKHPSTAVGFRRRGFTTGVGVNRLPELMSSTAEAKKNSVSPKAPRFYGFRPFFFFKETVYRSNGRKPVYTHAPARRTRPRRKSVSSAGKPRHYIVRIRCCTRAVVLLPRTDGGGETEKYESAVNEILLQVQLPDGRVYRVTRLWGKSADTVVFAVRFLRNFPSGI